MKASGICHTDFEVLSANYGVDAVYSEVLESAFIFGAGPMGMLMAIALKTKGVNDVSLVDIDETRLELAGSFGFRPIASGSEELSNLPLTDFSFHVENA